MTNTRSSIIQCLIDLRSTALDHYDDDFANKIKYLIDSEQGYPELFARAARKYDLRQHPDKTITWSRRAKYRYAPILLTINASALRVFDFLSANAGRGGMIQVKKKDLAKVLKESASTITRSLRTLKQHGLIVEIKKASRHESTILAINPIVDATGKTNLSSADIYMRYLDDDAHSTFEKANSDSRILIEYQTVRHADKDWWLSYAKIMP